MVDFDPKRYGPAFAELLQIDRLRRLDEGSPEIAMRDQLAELSPRIAFEQAEIVDTDMARCCLAGIWLLYDFLDESHTVSQAIGTTSGSYWHGIMHRREGDFSNAKYWFRKVGDHPVYGRLADELVVLGEERFLSAGQWDPFDFVDACQAAGADGANSDACRRVQHAEWELLFDYCYNAATA